MAFTHPGKRRLLVRSAQLAALLGSLALTSCGESQASSAKRATQATSAPQVVRTVEATPVTVTPTIRVTGTLFADEDVVVSAKVSGRVRSIEHDLGDRVASGTLLAQIDPTDYELAARERELAIEATLARLSLTELPSADFDPAQVPAVRRTALQLENARARYERLRKLFEQTPPLISEQEMADAQTAYEVAQSSFDVEATQAKALIAEAATLKAELDIARQRLADTRIVAPIDRHPQHIRDGQPRSYVIAERLISVGEYVREGDSLFRLIDDNPIKLRAMVPERFVSAVQPGLGVSVSVQAYDEPFRGQVSRVSPQIDPASRTFPVEVLIDNKDGLLKAGAFATARIELPRQEKAVRVPATAVASFAGVHRVFIVRDGKAVEARVELRDRNDAAQTIDIARGLEGGEHLVLAPSSTLVSGTPVQVEAHEPAHDEQVRTD